LTIITLKFSRSFNGVLTSFSLVKINALTLSTYTSVYGSTKLIYDSIPILYLSKFYTDFPHHRIINENIKNIRYDSGQSTKFLLETIKKYKEINNYDKVILYCEPIMGDNPKSITIKNYKLSKDERYRMLIEYYKKLGLVNTIETNNTLHNYLLDDGRVEDNKRIRISQFGYI
jgi:hypothetical protein